LNLKINDSNYEYYKSIFEIIVKHKGNINPLWKRPDVNPVNVLNSWEIQSKSLAKRGLKEGLRDSISSFKDFPKEFLQSLDEDLKKNDLPGVRILQSLVSDTVNKVLKRKSIKNLDEYYIVKEVVIDQASEINEQDRILLDQYFFDFEFKSKTDK